MIWDDLQKEKLRKLFPLLNNEELSKEFHTTIQAINRKAYYFGFKKLKKSRSKSKMEVLLGEDYITYYWIGFLLADGSFTKREELRLLLSVKDLDHLIKFSQFINKTPPQFTKNKKYCYVQSKDVTIIPKLKEKFNIDNIKTYNPPDIFVFEKMDDNKFLSCIIGFIDGDGCIRHQTNRIDYSLQLGCYKTWKFVFIYWLNRLNKIFNCNCKSRIFFDKDGTLRLTITKTDIIRGLKNKCIELNLPFLNRKWDKVNENFKIRKDKSEEIVKKIKILLQKKYSRKQICNILNIKKNTLSTIINRNKLSLRNLKLPNPQQKSILQYDKNGILIKRWNSITEAARYNKICNSSIRNMTRGLTKSAGGYVWKYADM